MRVGKRHRPDRYQVSLILGLLTSLWPMNVFAQEAEPTPASGALPRINPTSRVLPLVAPLMRGGGEVGVVDLQVAPDDTISISVDSLLRALDGQLRSDRLAEIRAAFVGRDYVPLAAMAAYDLHLEFEQNTLEVILRVEGDQQAVRQISLRPRNVGPIGEFNEPAKFSAYVNVRSSVDYVWDGAASDPAFGFDGALRTFGVVLEAEGGYRRTQGDESNFVRSGTRLVYDHRGLLMRFTAGDLLTEARGFQSAPFMAGFSISRSYRELDPTRNVYPRGSQSFTLQRSARVDVVLNGLRVDTLQLAPGSYNLQDFPFYSGANNVALEIEDDVGQRETLQFDVFFDRQLLQRGAREFGAYAGIASTPSFTGPEYNSDRPQFSGFYRAGVNDTLTLGINAQADEFVQQAGFEVVWGTDVGLFGLDVAGSNAEGVGTGAAVNGIWQSGSRTIDGPQRRAFIGFNYRTEEFASLGENLPSNPFNYEVFGGYSRAIGERTFFNASLSYSAGRTGGDVSSARAGFSRVLSRNVTASVEAVYQRRLETEESGIRFTLARRFGPSTSVTAIYDSAEERGSLDLYTGRGQGVGAWYASADIQTDQLETAANASFQYNANRAQVTLDHHTPVESENNTELQQRTSLRVASSFAFADGVFGIGRPIYDSFAVAAPHRSLRDAEVELDVNDVYYEGRSSIFGGAVAPNIASYSERSVIYTVPDAPAGYDLGDGSLRVLAPYRSGYSVRVGSDYSITAMGRLLDADGQVVTLLAGRAVEVRNPEREPIVVLTNRDGRFIVSGVRPGRWRITMPTQPASVVEIEISEEGANLVQLGDVRLREER